MRNRMQIQEADDATVSPTPAASREGWEDARLGLSYRRFYERMSELEQRNYEHSRQVVETIRAAGLAVPEWPRGRIPYPPEVIEARKQAITLVGWKKVVV